MRQVGLTRVGGWVSCMFGGGGALSYIALMKDSYYDIWTIQIDVIPMGGGVVMI